MQFIESKSNPQFKQASRWVHQPRTLRQIQWACAEGLHPLQELLAWPGLLIEQVWIAQSLSQSAQWLALQSQLQARFEVKLFVVSDAMYWQLSELSSGFGPMCFFQIPESTAHPTQACDVLVLDAVQDPGNMGTLIRTAAAAGLTEVWLTEGCTNPWSSKVLRAGMGGHRLVQLRKIEDTQLPDWFSSIPVYATALSEATSLYDMNLQAPCVWVLGSEGAGVSSDWLSKATARVFIPQVGHVESLNVGVACGVCLFEQQRQRGAVL